MSVLVRSKAGERLRTRRHVPVRHSEVRQASAPAVPRQADVEPGHPEGKPLANDHALYSCACGFVFQAPVSTSVSCPHCGDPQAW
jgi:hypothetical protein